MLADHAEDSAAVRWGYSDRSAACHLRGDRLARAARWREAAARRGTPFVGENALTRFDRYAYDRIIENVYFDKSDLPPMAGFTFLRLVPRLLRESNLTEFVRFLTGMREAARTLAARRNAEGGNDEG